MKINKKELGLRIKKLRKQKNLSMNELANYINVASKSTVNTWERGQSTPNKETLEKLANFFNVSVGFIKYGSLKNYLLELVKTDLNSYDSILYDDFNNLLKTCYSNYFDMEDTDKSYSAMEDYINSHFEEIKKSLGNALFYDNDYEILKLLDEYLSDELLDNEQNSFMGQVNSIDYYLTSLFPFYVDYIADKYNNGNFDKKIYTIINKIKNKYPSKKIEKTLNAEALNALYGIKLHDLIKKWLQELNNLKNDYQAINYDKSNNKKPLSSTTLDDNGK